MHLSEYDISLTTCIIIKVLKHALFFINIYNIPYIVAWKSHKRSFLLKNFVFILLHIYNLHGLSINPCCGQYLPVYQFKNQTIKIKFFKTRLLKTFFTNFFITDIKRKDMNKHWSSWFKGQLFIFWLNSQRVF